MAQTTSNDHGTTSLQVTLAKNFSAVSLVNQSTRQRTNDKFLSFTWSRRYVKNKNCCNSAWCGGLYTVYKTRRSSPSTHLNRLGPIGHGSENATLVNGEVLNFHRVYHDIVAKLLHEHVLSRAVHVQGVADYRNALILQWAQTSGDTVWRKGKDCYRKDNSTRLS